MAFVEAIDWDEGNVHKAVRHGVSIRELEEVFGGEFDVYSDPTHSQSETRWRAVGRTAAGRSVFVVFTLRERAGLRLARVISARYMHAKEVARYEKAAVADIPDR